MISTITIRTPDGELHIRRAGQATSLPPLLCLHPCPFSGLYFSTFMPLVASDRLVLAPDYPGYGASTPPPMPPAISDYATAMLVVLDGLGLQGPVDVLGFHTGCLVGVELAVTSPERVRRLLLIDVPCYTPARQRVLLAEAGAPAPANDTAEALAAAWRRHASPREGAMPEARIRELFDEHQRVLPRAHWGFRAAFSYPCAERFAAVRTPTRVIATRSGLLDATRAGAALLPDADLRERLDVTRAVFEEGAATIADEARRWLT